MYVGGGNDNIILDYMRLLIWPDEDKLIPELSYVIADYETTGYSLIILTAASEFTILSKRICVCPSCRNIGMVHT